MLGSKACGLVRQGEIDDLIHFLTGIIHMYTGKDFLKRSLIFI